MFLFYCIHEQINVMTFTKSETVFGLSYVTSLNHTLCTFLQLNLLHHLPFLKKMVKSSQTRINRTIKTDNHTVKAFTLCQVKLHKQV